MRRAYIYVPGVLAWPGMAEGWTDRAVTWTHIHTPYRAEKFEYLAGPLTRMFLQQQRAEKLARMIGYYKPKEYELVIVAHSNGCDVVLRALRLIERSVSSVHMFAPGCSDDMTANGIPELLKSARIYALGIHLGGMDQWMQVAAGIMRRFNGGHGLLGASAPARIRFLLAGLRAGVTSWPEYGHRAWFERGDRFERTMQVVMRESGGEQL